MLTQHYYAKVILQYNSFEFSLFLRYCMLTCIISCRFFSFLLLKSGLRFNCVNFMNILAFPNRYLILQYFYWRPHSPRQLYTVSIIKFKLFKSRWLPLLFLLHYSKCTFYYWILLALLEICIPCWTAISIYIPISIINNFSIKGEVFCSIIKRFLDFLIGTSIV